MSVSDNELRALLAELDDVWRMPSELNPRGISATRLPAVLRQACRRGLAYQRRGRASANGRTQYAISDAGDEYIGRSAEDGRVSLMSATDPDKRELSGKIALLAAEQAQATEDGCLMGCARELRAERDEAIAITSVVREAADYWFAAHNEAIAEIARLTHELERLAELVRHAPHAYDCEAGASVLPGLCSCWKREALLGTDEEAGGPGS